MKVLNSVIMKIVINDSENAAIGIINIINMIILLKIQNEQKISYTFSHQNPFSMLLTTRKH